ncbi:GDCCVxC domain-containing (seleno)protein [Sulfuritortus calidifontis]|nr:GDCCVxC domain-containing (seleno)protein [Sulfuritortus calidifontis]
MHALPPGLRPKPGHCRVFCSYGTGPCPPIQQERGNSGRQCGRP